MSDLERRLREVDPATVFPATPDLAGPVARRIARPRLPTLVGARSALAVLLAALVAAGALLAASPGARSTIRDLLGLQGASIERGQPRVTRATPPVLGRATSLAEARRVVGFKLAVPSAGLGRPGRVGIDRSIPRRPLVSLTWNRGRRDGAPLVLTQMRATAEPTVAKTAPSGTRVEGVKVRGQPGYWLAGAPHQLELVPATGRGRVGDARLVRETLLWEHNGLLLRLEGAGSKVRALAIARSIP